MRRILLLIPVLLIACGSASAPVPVYVPPTSPPYVPPTAPSPPSIVEKVERALMSDGFALYDYSEAGRGDPPCPADACMMFNDEQYPTESTLAVFIRRNYVDGWITCSDMNIGEHGQDRATSAAATVTIIAGLDAEGLGCLEPVPFELDVYTECQGWQSYFYVEDQDFCIQIDRR